MASIREGIHHPSYEAKATGVCKIVFVAFLGTFLYMLYGERISPGFVGGLIFIIVGQISTTFGIALPLTLLHLKLPKLSFVIFFLEVGLTIVVTKWAYLYFFAS